MQNKLDARHDFLRKHEIPEQWRPVTLGEVADLIGGGTPSREEGRFWQGGTIPWATPTDLTANESKYILKTKESITEAGLSSSAATLLPIGSILYTSRATIGAKAIASVPIATNQGFASFIPREIDGEFLYYLLDELTPIIKRLGSGTTFDEVSKRDIRKIYCAVPVDKNEQAAIARILDAVDTTIERTREAVERAEVLKLALMQAAFSFEMTNESHKSSDAGHIPESWQAIKGKQAFTVLSGGNSSVFALKPLREEVEADAWFMKVDDFNLPDNSRRIVKTQIGFCAMDNPNFRLLPIGTIVIAKRGAAILKNRVRTTAVPVALDPNLMGLQMQADIIPDFFRYQLEWRNLSRYIESSGLPQLNNKDIYPRWFLKPPEDQQKEIVSVIAATETYQDALLRKLNVIEQLKKSLMHDLLTGKVRVDLSNGGFQVPASFFEPLPDDLLDAFEGRQ